MDQIPKKQTSFIFFLPADVSVVEVLIENVLIVSFLQGDVGFRGLPGPPGPPGEGLQGPVVNIKPFEHLSTYTISKAVPKKQDYLHLESQI